MGATYTRQSSYSDGDVITAAHTNDEFNQLLAAFAASTGHTHDGTTAEGGPITKLLGNTLTFGAGTAGTDITVTFDGETSDGILKWMEDEDRFQFPDDILIESDEKLLFRDTAIYLNSSTDGQLDIVADTEVQIAATTIDMNGAVDISGNLTVGGNIVIGSADISEAELEVLDGLTVTTAEVNVLDGITSDVGELNLLDGSAAGNVVNSKAVIYSSGGKVNATSLQIAGTDLTATAAEFNLLDGGSTIGTTAVSDGHGILMNHGGTMGQTTVQTLAAYLDDEITAMPNLVSTGALDSGSITSGFGTINTGSSTITTTGLITGGSLDIDNVLIDGATIGHTDDTDLITLSNGVVTVAGELDATTLDISGNADIDGTLEADAITVDGTGLVEFIQDTVGAMVSSNTETGITVTYEDGDGTLDFVVGSVDAGATQTTIESIKNTSLVIGRDDDNLIKFTTDNQIIFEVEGSDNVIFKQSGEIEASSLDISGDADIDGTLEADAITVGGTALNTVIAGVTVANATNATTAAVATTVTITDNENTDEDNAIIFTSGGDIDGGNIGLESDGDLTYNPNTGTLTSNKVKILTTDNTAGLTLECTDDDDNDGPIIDLHRNSANPSDNDHLGKLVFSGQDAAGGNKTTFVEIATEARDLSTSEDARLDFNLVNNGTLTNYLRFDTELGITFNDSSDDIDFRIESDDNANMFFIDAGSNHVNIGTSTDYSGVLNVLSTDNGYTLSLVSTDDDSSVGPNLQFRRDSSSPANDDFTGAIYFTAENSSGANHIFSQINSSIVDVTAGSEDGRLETFVYKDGSEISSLKIDGTSVVFNEGSNDVDFRIESNGDVNMFEVDANANSGAGSVGIARNAGAGDSFSDNQLEVFGSARFQSGILFGSDTSTDNMLYDYEEGTFVPNAEFTTTNPTSGGVTTGNGLYTKIGRLVTIHMRLLNINDTGAAGDLKISNLPFTSLVDSGDGAVATFTGSVSHAHCNHAGSTYLTSEVLDNKSEARIIENIDNSNRDPVNTGNINDGTTDFFITITYQTAS